MRKILPFTISFLAAILFLVTENKSQIPTEQITSPKQISIIPESKKPEKPKITTEIPSYLTYPQIASQLMRWKKEAKDYVEIGNYGKSVGENIYYAKLTNKLSKNKKIKILLTGAIHGNEQWSTCIVMACTGTILAKHTSLLDNYEIYIIPSVCPTSYGVRREINGLDPNRNFQNQQPLPPIQAIKSFFEKHKFDAVMSGHTCGRVFLFPPGNSYAAPNPKIANLCEKLAQLSGYQIKQLCYNYSHVIHGTEADWYASQGAVAVICEIGTHMNAPREQEIYSEFNRLFPAYLYFIKNATSSKG